MRGNRGQSMVVAPQRVHDYPLSKAHNNSFPDLHQDPSVLADKRPGDPSRLNLPNNALTVSSRPAGDRRRGEQPIRTDYPRSNLHIAQNGKLIRGGVSIGNQDKHPQEPMVSRISGTYSSQASPQQMNPSKHAPAYQNVYGSRASMSALEAVGSGPPRKPTGAVIFLDVDGVLHPVNVTRQDQLFRRDKMSMLRHLIQQTGAEICLSSAWRLQPQTMRIVNQELVRHGMNPAIDKTGDFGRNGKRSSEILKWVASHEPSAWVAIDDMDLTEGELRMRGHFLHTNSFVGLTVEGIEQALRMLKKGT